MEIFIYILIAISLLAIVSIFYYLKKKKNNNKQVNIKGKGNIVIQGINPSRINMNISEKKDNKAAIKITIETENENKKSE